MSMSPYHYKMETPTEMKTEHELVQELVEYLLHDSFKAFPPYVKEIRRDLGGGMFRREYTKENKLSWRIENDINGMIVLQCKEGAIRIRIENNSHTSITDSFAVLNFDGKSYTLKDKNTLSKIWELYSNIKKKRGQEQRRNIMDCIRSLRT